MFGKYHSIDIDDNEVNVESIQQFAGIVLQSGVSLGLDIYQVKWSDNWQVVYLNWG